MKLRDFFIGLLLIFSASDALCYSIYEENGKVGIKNNEGKVLIPAIYEAIGWSNGSFSVLENITGYKLAGKWGLINLANHIVVRNEFLSLLPSGSHIIASRKDKTSIKAFTGLINTSGKQILPFQYDGIEVHSLRAIVFTRVGNQFRYGLVDLQNQTLIPQQYQDVQPLGTLRFSVRNFDGKTAVFTDNGQQITGFDIDSLSQFKDNYARIYKGKFVGLIDRTGAIKVEPKYRDIEIRQGSIQAREANEWIFFKGDKSEVRRARFDSIIVVGSNLLRVVTGNHVELCDGNLAPLGNAALSYIGPFKKNRAPYRIGELSGVILSDGKVLLPAIYHQVLINGDLILANQKQNSTSHWILFDSTGARVTSRTYSEMRPAHAGLFTVKSKGYWGVIDKTGKEIVACAYDSILAFRENVMHVRFRGLNGIISLKEEWLVPPKANALTIINKSRYLEHTTTTTFLKEMNGNVIYFSTNPLEIKDNFLFEYLPSGNCWKIDLQGVIVERNTVPAEPIEKIFEESEGYRAIRKNGKYGFIDSRGRLRIANRYEDVHAFSEGYAGAKILGKWGFINLQDNLAVQPIYEEVRAFKGGFALVKQKGLYGLIDKTGRQVLPVRYDSIQILSSGYLLVAINGLVGLADHTGKMLIQPRFEKLSYAGDGFSIVYKNAKYGVVAVNGISTIPLQYDYLAYDSGTKVFHAMTKASWQDISKP
jgi:hypothetical protein